MFRVFACLLALLGAPLFAADLEFHESLELPECHSIGWVGAWLKADPASQGPGWNGVLDEAKWGTPSPQQVVTRNWDWKITDEQWRQAVQQRGPGKNLPVTFDLWIPEGIDVLKGLVVISGHGSGTNLYQHPTLRNLARELHLGLFKFLGDPVQRGFWPRSLLAERLHAFGATSRHPELDQVPLFLYGHSNGTGFSAIFPSAPAESQRVWGWVSMRPGIAFQVYQPGAAQVPGLVIFGEDDPFLARPSKEENLAVVPLLRKQHHALWNTAVEPKTGHGPGEKTWPLVFSFLRHSFAARVPSDADPRQGAVKLNSLSLDKGYLGQNWDPAQGGYQDLAIAPFASFAGDKSSASWLLNAAYATDWQRFQKHGSIAAPAATSPRYRPDALPKGTEYFQLRDGLANCQRKFVREKTGRIAFLGGSITAGGGWRDHTMKYFQEKFPETKFEFIAAGIGSLGSVPHAFRLERDVLSKGPVDLLFVEAAVNDTSNTANPVHMLRGMEGVVRHARLANPLTDIVQMHFVMPEHMTDYRAGKTPQSIAQHERVAEAYGNPSLHLAREVTDRIDAGEFTWDDDFKNLHPSPFGHQLYANSIARMLNAAFAKPPAESSKPHATREPIDPQSYFRGRFGDIHSAQVQQGFTLDPAWKPADGKGTRAGFVEVPALVGTHAGSEFTFAFEGTGAGLFITSGPDAGKLEFKIDGGPWHEVDTLTRWSPSLHLPWALILEDNLPLGTHQVSVRLTDGALRIFHLLLN